MTKQLLIDEFHRETDQLKQSENEVHKLLDAEYKHLHETQKDITHLVAQIGLLSEKCAHFAIFEYLLDEFLKVA